MFIATAATVIGAGATINSVLGDPLGIGPDTAPMDQANQSAAAANQASAAAQLKLAEISQEQWDQYKQMYQDYGQPALKSVATEAMQPSDQAVRDAKGRANADVTGAFDIARKADASRMQSMGINPGSPAFQSGQGSWQIAEAGSKAGAMTDAARRAREDSYNKRLGIYGLVSGMEGPATAGVTNAARVAAAGANAADRNAFLQGTQYRNDLRAQGAGIESLGPAAQRIGTVAQKWFGTPTYTGSSGAFSAGAGDSLDPFGMDFAEGGKVGYKDGNFVARAGMDAAAQADMIVEGRRKPRERIIEAERIDQGVTMRGERLEQQREIMSNSLPTVKHKAGGPPAPMPMGAFFKRKRHAEGGRIYGPHMRRYAMGGEVEDQGLEPRDMMMADASQMGMMAGPGTETSDSIPAVVDGQEPAALSTNEFVMNAEVPKMTGEEILEAINQAGLAKRQGAGLEVRGERGESGYADGGDVGQDFAPMMDDQNAAYMRGLDSLRADGSQKGSGFLGPMKRPDGRVSTEISIGVPINGKQMEIPAMVPTLTQQEIDYLINNDEKAVLRNTPIAAEIRRKAVEHAQKRLGSGANPFAGPPQSFARGGRINRRCAGL